MNLGTLKVKMGADTSGLDRGLRKAQRSVKAASRKIQQAAQMATVALAGIGTAGGYLIKAASDAEELQNVINVSFGQMADDINNWAAETAEAVNRSDYQITKFVGTSKAMLQSMVETDKKANEMSKTITQLAVDLASFRNISDKRAFEALTGALTGQAEMLKRLGYNIQETALEQYALNHGIEQGVREMSESQKVMLRYNVIMDKMKNIMGDAERTSGSFANQLKGFWGEVRNLREELGQYLLPTATKAVTKARKMIKNFSEMDSAVKKTIIRFSGLTAGVLSSVVALGLIAKGAEIVVGTLSVLGSAFVALSNPVTFVVALAYTFYSAWEQNLWGIRDNIKGLWNSFKDWYDNVMSGNDKTANYFFENFKTAFEAVWGVLKWLINRNIDFYKVVENVAQMSYEVVADNWDKIAEFIGGILDWILEKIKWFAEKVGKTFNYVSDEVEKTVNKSKSKDGFIGRILEGTGEDHVANIAKSLDDAVQIARKKAPKIAGEISKWTVKAKQGMSELFEAIKKTAGETFDKILKLVKKRAPKLYKKIKEIVDAFNFDVNIGVSVSGDKSKGGADKGGMGPLEVRKVPNKLPSLTLAEKLSKVWKKVGGKIKNVKKEFIKLKDNMIRGLSDAIVKGESLSKVFDKFLDQLASAILQEMVIGPAVNSVFAGLPTGHSGGIVTGKGIKKFHDGGQVGLSQNEVPAILEKGETVLTEDQTKAVSNSMGGTTNIFKINAVDAKSFAELAAKNPEAITNVVNNDIAKNGPTRKTIKQNL